MSVKSFVLICDDEEHVDEILRKKESSYKCRTDVDQFTPTKNFILAVKRPNGYYAKGYVAFLEAIVKYDPLEDKSGNEITFEFKFANPFVFDDPFQIEPDFFGLYRGKIPSGRCLVYEEMSVKAISNAVSMYNDAGNPLMRLYSISEETDSHLKEAKKLSHIPMRTLIPASTILYAEHIRTNVLPVDSVDFTPRAKLKSISVYSPEAFTKAITELGQTFDCEYGVVLNASVLYVYDLLLNEETRAKTCEHLNKIISEW